jgi:hypothetical protein
LIHYRLNRGSDVNTVEIAPPWGIKQVTPLLKIHRVRLTESGMAPAFSLGLHAVPLGAAEFAVALRDYPIVFLQREAAGPLEAMAILGIEEAQNLFVMPDGRWDRRTYMPAYMRRYPFSVATVAGESGKDKRVICVDPQALDNDGARLFDDSGASLPLWIEIQSLLNEYEDELNQARQLGAKLQRLGALAPFSLHADLFSGFSLSLDGMYRVDRNKLAALEPQALRELISKGEMEWVYSHLLSQENFLRLLSRRRFFGTRPAA